MVTPKKKNKHRNKVDITAYKTHPILAHINCITMGRWKLNSEPDYGLDMLYDSHNQHISQPIKVTNRTVCIALIAVQE